MSELRLGPVLSISARLRLGPVLSISARLRLEPVLSISARLRLGPVLSISASAKTRANVKCKDNSDAKVHVRASSWNLPGCDSN